MFDTIIGVVDYAPYLDRGINVSPYKPSDTQLARYDLIGAVELVITHGFADVALAESDANLASKDVQKQMANRYVQHSDSIKWFIPAPTYITDKFIQLINDYEADAVFEFKIDLDVKDIASPMYGVEERRGVVSGVLARRKTDNILDDE